MANHADTDHTDTHKEVVESAMENYTGSELPYRALYISGIALAVTSVVFAVALIPLRDALTAAADRRSEGQIQPINERPSASRLQQNPEGDWQVWEALMTEQMNSYGYNDKSQGLVHIPADRAIELALSENLIRSTPDAVPAVLHGVSAGHDDTDHGVAEHGGSSDSGEESDTEHRESEEASH